ncbi:hypothetical protein FS837_012959 [Tulasnella sp. UAMH 9824]|nr:hypothetical protein FS837_012959 [Tulasnella sp. UAMH 9824]
MITVAQYPLDIPLGTGVPAWAYQNVSIADTWNQTLALPQISVAPESTYYGTPTATVSYNVTTAGGGSTQTGATSATTTNESSKSNAGPIAGGVVGGIFLLALIGVLVWLLLQRRRNEAQDPSVTGYYTTDAGQMGETNYFPAAVDYGTSYPTSTPTIFSGSRRTPDTPKLYDPDDPSTFPKTPASFGYQSTVLTSTATAPDHGSTPVGRYKGAAEI